MTPQFLTNTNLDGDTITQAPYWVFGNT